MAIKSSGSLAISEIVTEFGGSTPHSLSEYYAGAGLVAAGTKDPDGNAIPSSGTIKISDFYACSKFVAQSFSSLTSSTTSTVPAGANAVHIEFAVAGGGSGAYISDKVFTVTAGETLAFTVGAAGTGVDISVQQAAQTPGSREATFSASLDQVATAGGTTSLSGSSTGSIFSLGGGGGASGINGDVAGPFRTNTAGSAGSATVSTSVSSGTFVNASNVGVNLSTLTSGPTGTFNDSGNGAAGGNNGNCSGDNCRIGGSTGGASYNGNVSGGSGGSSAGSGTAGGAGTRGSGGGGGSAQIPSIGSTDGGNGGAGEIKFRYIRVS